MGYSHIPVMLKEVVDILSPQDGEVFVDATFGMGGYTKEILDSAYCKVHAIDLDETTDKFFVKLKEDYRERVSLNIDNFMNIKRVISSQGLEKVDGIVFDLGISSMQVDDGSRGFSFRQEGALDMRMGSSIGVDAGYFVNKFPEEEMANIIFQYGDERFSRSIAKAIVNYRQEQEIKSTVELAEIIAKVVPRFTKGINPATKTFQAIRIWVNDELNSIKNALKNSFSCLNPGGRIVVVSFHSGEDRIVKNIFRECCGVTRDEKNESEFEYINKRVIKPSEMEVKYNIRSRSAKLRAILKR